MTKAAKTLLPAIYFFLPARTQFQPQIQNGDSIQKDRRKGPKNELLLGWAYPLAEYQDGDAIVIGALSVIGISTATSPWAGSTASIWRQIPLPSVTISQSISLHRDDITSWRTDWALGARMIARSGELYGRAVIGAPSAFCLRHWWLPAQQFLSGWGRTRSCHIWRQIS